MSDSTWEGTLSLDQLDDLPTGAWVTVLADEDDYEAAGRRWVRLPICVEVVDVTPPSARPMLPAMEVSREQLRELVADNRLRVHRTATPAELDRSRWAPRSDSD